jgi:hypothetical protein
LKKAVLKDARVEATRISIAGADLGQAETGQPETVGNRLNGTMHGLSNLRVDRSNVIVVINEKR